MEPVKKALADAKKQPKDIVEVVLVGGSTRIPLVQGDGQEVLRQGPAPGGEPGRGRRGRRGGPGGRSLRRREGHGPPRRDAALARRRDAGRRHDGDDPAQHDDPDAEEGDLLHGDRQPAERRGARPPGRAHRGAVQPDARQVPPRGDHAGAARRAEGRGHVRHRRERHPLGPREGHGDGQGPEDHHHRELGRSPRRTSRGWSTEAAGARGRGQGAARADRAPQQARQPLLHARKDASPRTRTRSRAT